MEKWKNLTQKFFFLSIGIFIFVVVVVIFPGPDEAIPNPIRNLRRSPNSCPLETSDKTITPLKNTKHLLVSAYMDQRVKGFDICIISIFRRDSIQPLQCLFCCAGQVSNTTTPAKIKEHSDNFGFPFATADIMCQIPQTCRASHVRLLTQLDSVKVSSQIWLPIRNQKTKGKTEELQYDFTVCISNLFESNNALQYAQTLEMYRLLGVDRVVIYNTSCGPDLDRLLQSYSQEGFVEMVSWPITRYMNPSRGFSKYGGAMYYFGQLATLNECIYRSMDRSHYVLLHDIDEIIMPYQHPKTSHGHTSTQKLGCFLLKIISIPRNPMRIPNVNNVLRRAGLLRSERKA